MTTESERALQGVELKPLHEFTEKAYLDYSMYVILDRALPHIADGLKPVQRRIIYAMSELGLSAQSKPKKSARTVGDVLGKFHPHGDTACYEAMVLMAQRFSYRYPLVDGQGNWGSQDDPKSFAAMRYTEAKLSPFAKLLLSELGQGTVDWVPNFDGTLKEPALLPAQVPHVLLNGAMGIAVGMSTDIPPHNVTEVINACLHILKFPGCSIRKLCDFIQAPDLPSGSEIITSKEDLIKLYQRGHGSYRARATYSIEEGEIVINSLPHQVSGAKVLEQIAHQMQQKKLTWVSDLRDESDQENPIRIVITPRSNRIDTAQLMGHLFASTDLERSYRVNLNIIGLDGKPQVKNLSQILTEWLQYRQETVVRRTEFRLDKVRARMHILEGLLVVYLNLDEVIRIIRTEDEPKPVLMERFNLSSIQADAILDTKLRHLAKLEEMKLQAERDELQEEADALETLLGSDQLLKAKIAQELREVRDQHGDQRRTQVVEREEAKALDENALTPAETVTVVLSKLGWVRCAKGADIDGSKLNYRSGDQYLSQCQGKSNQQAVFIDSKGRSYSLVASKLPSARGQGEPLTGRFKLQAGAKFVHATMGVNTQKVLVGSTSGYGFVTSLIEMTTKNKAGKALITTPEYATTLPPLACDYSDEEYLCLISQQGRMLIYALQDLPELTKGKGNKLMGLKTEDVKNGDDCIVFWAIIKPGADVKIHAGKKYLKLDLEQIETYFGERGRRGNFLPNGYRKVTGIEINEIE